MQSFMLVAFVLAAASASHIVAPYATVYAGPQHLPIINHEGVPVDTASVQHARAAHLSHKINVHARNGDLAVAHAVAPVLAHGAHIAAASPVIAARSAVIANHGVYYGHGHGYLLRKRRSILAAPLAYHYAGAQHLPIINHEGVPVDTASVQHARAAHLAHKVNVHARNGDYAYAPVVASAYSHGVYPLGYAAHLY